MDDTFLQTLLADDVPLGDLTTTTLGIGSHPARLTFRARQSMALAAVEEAARLFGTY